MNRDPAQATSRNPLEQTWALTHEEFSRRARNAPLPTFTAARDETAAITEKIGQMEAEINARDESIWSVTDDS